MSAHRAPLHSRSNRSEQRNEVRRPEGDIDRLTGEIHSENDRRSPAAKPALTFLMKMEVGKWPTRKITMRCLA